MILLWFFLAALALVLLVVLSIPVWLLSLVLLFRRANWKTWAIRQADWYHGSAFILDVAAGVLFRHVLDLTCLKKNGRGAYRFGQYEKRETISRTLAINLKTGHLSRFGLGVCKFLEWVDEGHLAEALKNHPLEPGEIEGLA